jgi:hypothetical protein
MRVAGFDAVYAIADEDLARENDSKTSAVHFLRFEFSTTMIAAARADAAFAAGIDHPRYDYSVEPLPEPLRSELLADFG